MKISPEAIIADNNLCLKYKSFFISGNDEGYISALASLIAEFYLNRGFVKKNLTDENGVGPDLFKIEDGYVFVCEKNINNNTVEEIENNNDILIICQKTSPKNKSTKQFFSNSNKRALVDCYELDQARKKIILNAFIQKNNLVFEKSIYWFLLDSLDNRFGILNRELEKILLINNKNSVSEITSALNMDMATEANKFYFKIHSKKSDLCFFLSSSVGSLSDFYSYFSYFKFYSLLLLGSKNKSEFESKIPKYLFREKQNLLKLFDSLNKDKKYMLSALVFKTERLVRKNPALYNQLFFRFVLNYKKIIS